MENRKQIPVIQTSFDDLEGTAKSTDAQYDISGRIFLNEMVPYFEGTWRTPFGNIMEIPELNLYLNCSKKNLSITCEKCAVTNTSGSNSFKASILSLKIRKGNVKENDNVEIFIPIRSKKFGGAEFDQFNVRCINFLDFIGENARLYSSQISSIDDCNGYFYLPMKLSRFTNLDQQLGEKLYSLLLFFFGDFVGFPYKLYWKNEQEYIVEINPSLYSKNGGGLFYAEYPHILNDYMQNAWDAWETYQDSLNLQTIINYYVLMLIQSHIEVKLLLGSVLMEALKYRFASKIRNYQQDRRGFFLKPNSLQTTFTFEELIIQLYEHFGVENGDTSFIRYRNEVVHQGQIDLPFSNKMDQYNLLLNSIESILLKALNYRGKIWDRLNEKYITI